MSAQTTLYLKFTDAKRKNIVPKDLFHKFAMY